MAIKETTTATAETSVELILRLEIVKTPITVRGSLLGGKLEEVSGVAVIKKSLNSFLEDMAPDFGVEASSLLRDLTGGPDITLDGLEFGYHNQDPQFTQLVVTFLAGASRCRLVCLKSANGYLAGLELRLARDLFKGSFISGLVGDISLGYMGVYYASTLFKNVAYNSGEDLQSADEIPVLTSPGRRDFTQGMNWAAQVSIGKFDLFNWPKTDATKLVTQTPPATPIQSTASSPSKLDDGTTWIELNKSLGPLTVQRIGLKYDAPKVAIKFDAGLQLSVLTLSLQGLGLSYPLNQLSVLIKSPLEFFKHVEFQLDGASVAIQQGPVTIAGGLLVVSRKPLELLGTLLIRVPGISISAIASYTDLNGTFSFFAFAVLQAELGDPTGTGCFLITGLAFGFGMNRALKLPPIEEVQNFPLVKAATDADYLGKNLDLRAINQKLGDSVYAAAGQYWVAAGLKFNSYGLIDSFALFSVSFGNDLEIGLLGLSTLAIPKGGKPGEVIAYAELAMRAVIKPAEGLIAVEARLTAESYILSQDCHLTGGFAFYIWFSGTHAGDFIASLGGYHPKFLRPAHYPLVPRLGVNWNITSELAIVAEFYFALTASCLMAGGRISAVYQSSGIKAWFIAYADFLLNWKPFYYTADMRISIGVEVNLEIFSFTLHLSVGLRLWGPEFAGVIEVDLTVFTLEIKFGPAKDSPKPIGPKEFVSTFLPKEERVIATQINSGLIAEQKVGDRVLRVVNAHALALTTQSVIPVTEFKGFLPEVESVASNPGDLGIRSMGETSLASSYEVTIKRGEDEDIVDKSTTDNLRISCVTANVPEALWGPSREQGQVKLATVPEPGKMTVKASVGLRISFDPKYPEGTLPAIDIEKFKFMDLPKPIPWNSLQPSQHLSAEEEKGKEIHAWMSEVTQKRRKAALAVLQGNAVRADFELTAPFPPLNEVKLDRLVLADASYFQANPEIRRLGEPLRPDN